MNQAARAAFVVALIMASGLAHAAPFEPPAEDDSVKVKYQPYVIQNRKYELNHEFLFSSGVLPVDPYYKSVIGTFGYTVHFNDHWAWEIGQFSYAYNIQTSLMRKLKRTAEASGADTPNLPAIQWIAASHLVLKPLYGKEAMFNTKVVHLEAFLQLGPNVLNLTNTSSKLSFGADFGGGLRMWLSRTWSLRFDLSELVYLHDVTGKRRIRQAIQLRLGMAATLGGEE
ncbi:MAG: outer membrane beta-barrel domain-containing protein [Deltaproteobacteria bacterium]|nr:outer membrane beta-barrel domain-containing protein [Deltaproteobacteria bacterium]